MSRALKARNQLAAASRHHPEEVEDRRRALAEAKIADYIERTLAAAPPLSDQQRTALAELLKPVRVTSGRDDLLKPVPVTPNPVPTTAGGDE